MKLIFLMVILILFSTSLMVFAQEETKTGVITGRIIDSETKQPLPGVKIIVQNTKLGALTDKEGRYIIEKVPVGRYTVTAIMPGYKPMSLSDIVVVTVRSSYCDFELAVSSYESKGVEIKADKYDKTTLPSINSATVINNQEIRMTPGIPDLFRRMQSLAGVGRADESSASLIVRGGDPEENLTLVENIEIFSPFHFAGLSGENTGGMSIIEPRLVNTAIISTGGFSSLYGDRLSSVSMITLKDPEKRRLNGDLSLDMGGASAYFSGPLTSNTSGMISARRGIMDFLMKLADLDFNTQTWDFHSKFVWEPSPTQKVSLYGMYSQDRISGTHTGESNFGTDYYSDLQKSQYAFGINWNWLYSDRGYLLVTPYVSSSDWSLTSGPLSNKEETGAGNIETYLGIKSEMFYRLNEINRFTFGAEFRYIKASYSKFTGFDTLSTGIIGLPYDIQFEPDGSFKQSLSAQYHFDPVSWAGFVFGVRQDYFGFTKELAFDPRASMNLKLNDQLNLDFAWGIYSQFPQFYRIFYSPENKNLKTEKAVHYIAGIEYLFDENMQFKAEAYYKNLYDLPVAEDDTSKVFRSTGSGYASGIELTATRRMSDNLYVLLNYTYSVSKRRDEPNGEYYYFKYDRPHAANLIATYKLGDWWEFGLNVSYATGMPFTPYDFSTKREIDGKWYADLGKKNSDRFPDYFRIDLRVDRRFIFNSWNLRAYFEIWNLTNHDNVFEYQYSKDFSEIKKDVLFPFTPMIGVAAEF